MSFIDTMNKVGSGVSAALSPISAVSGAVGGVAGLIGSIGQGRRDRRTAKYNYELAERAADNQYNRQVQLMNLQNDQNIKNWNMQNEYNTPAAVRKRIEDAGLNPALMYGNSAGSVTAGGIQGGTPASAPGAVGAGSLPIGYQGDNLERMARIAQMNAQTENIEANTDKTVSEIVTEDFRRQLMSSEIDVNNSIISLNNVNAAVQKWNEMYLSSTFVDRVDINTQTLYNMRAEEKKIQQDINESISRVDLNNENKEKVIQEVKNLTETARMISAQADMAELQYEIQSRYGLEITQAQLLQIYALTNNYVSDSQLKAAQTHQSTKTSSYIQEQIESLSRDNEFYDEYPYMRDVEKFLSSAKDASELVERFNKVVLANQERNMGIIKDIIPLLAKFAVK